MWVRVDLVMGVLEGWTMMGVDSVEAVRLNPRFERYCWNNCNPWFENETLQVSNELSIIHTH